MLGGFYHAFRAFLGLKPKPPSTIASEDHSYSPGSVDSRSPCPGLNVLANHGYLPRDGKNISNERMEEALMAGYNMTHPLATFLTSIILPSVGKPGATTFDLTDLRKHNAIEHDVSLTRHDFAQGDNYTFQPEMLEAVLGDTGDGPATAKTFAKSRIRRTKESELAGVPKLSFKLVIVSVFNYGSALLVLGPSGISKEDLTTFFKEERSPLNLPLERRLTLLNYFWQGLRVLWHNYIHKPK
ncbi:hypothetical protein FGG08_005653 [Glutinoglossum americanum]|uniref:Heme haloperoxidase family profile domain-containing protein n=1 Tax=Glutinoglossum americanum TaxID=1670608 RepID=A0A9P8KVT7_9PEZI|nr:hypothetical protein FGG08_005653 [Glutinoglossum americanum]